MFPAGNCEKERGELKLQEKTFSLWGYLTNSADEFVNPLYDHASKTEVLTVNLSPQNIRFWRGLYCRFESGTHPREPVIGNQTNYGVSLKNGHIFEALEALD